MSQTLPDGRPAVTLRDIAAASGLATLTAAQLEALAQAKPITVGPAKLYPREDMKAILMRLGTAIIQRATAY